MSGFVCSQAQARVQLRTVEELVTVVEPRSGIYDFMVRTQAQRSVLESAYVVGSPGPSLCAAWVCNVFAYAGIQVPVYGAAREYLWEFCYSDDIDDLKVGMIVCGIGNNSYGHIGIYVGDGWVMSSETWYGEGTITWLQLDDFIDRYSTQYPVSWGWIGNIDLTEA